MQSRRVTGLKVVLSLALILQPTIALEHPANDLVKLQKAPHNPESLKNILSEIFEALSKKSLNLNLNKALQKDTNATTNITEIQAEIDQFFSNATNNLTEDLPYIVNNATEIQKVVSPVLEVVNALADQPVVQSLEYVYLVVLVAQGVLAIANNTLGDAEKIVYTTISSLNITQTIIDKGFEIVLAIL